MRFYGSFFGYLWSLARPFALFGVIYVVFSQFADSVRATVFLEVRTDNDAARGLYESEGYGRGALAGYLIVMSLITIVAVAAAIETSERGVDH